MAPSHESANRLATDLTRVFGARLRSVAVYGPHARGEARGPVPCLCLVTELRAADLDACAGQIRQWHAAGLATPLVVPLDEFRASLDAFPLEYGDIIEHHVVVAGEDLLAGAAVSPADLRRACETQVKSHLLHLRQQYLEAHGSPVIVARLLADAAPSFAALLERVASLRGVGAADADGGSRAGAALAGLPESTVSAVLALTHGDALTTPGDARLFPDYLAAVEQLAAFVDTWES